MAESELFREMSRGDQCPPLGREARELLARGDRLAGSRSALWHQSGRAICAGLCQASPATISLLSPLTTAAWPGVWRGTDRSERRAARRGSAAFQRCETTRSEEWRDMVLESLPMMRQRRPGTVATPVVELGGRRDEAGVGKERPPVFARPPTWSRCRCVSITAVTFRGREARRASSRSSRPSIPPK